MGCGSTAAFQLILFSDVKCRRRCRRCLSCYTNAIDRRQLKWGNMPPLNSASRGTTTHVRAELKSKESWGQVGDKLGRVGGPLTRRVRAARRCCIHGVPQWGNVLLKVFSLRPPLLLCGDESVMLKRTSSVPPQLVGAGVLTVGGASDRHVGGPGSWR